VVTGSVIGGNAMTVSTISTATLSVNSSTSIYNAGTLTVVNTNAIPAVSAAIIAPNMSLVGASGNLFVLGQATTQYNSMVMGWFSVGAGSTSNYLNINGYGNLTAETGLNITAGGNVGIGLTNPGYNLQVQGSIQAKNLTHFNWNNYALGSSYTASTLYYKIASVGPNTNSANGHLIIKGSIGGWTNITSMNVDLFFMSRGGITTKGIVKAESYTGAVSIADIKYYDNGSGYDIYIVTTSFFSFDLDVGSSGIQSLASVLLYDPSTVVATTTSPGALTSITAACQIYINGSNVGIGITNPSALHATTMYSAGTMYGQFVCLYGSATCQTITCYTIDPPASGAGWSPTYSILYVTRSTSTNRSINAAGTINASGADYAEYMVKNGTFTINKGDIVGVDSNGLLTNQYDNSITFMVKSTNPSYVGGDVWCTEDIVGKRPELPKNSTDADKSTYDLAFAAWKAAMEVERQKVDRIAYSGQVPVNVQGSHPGDYIIPIRNSDGSIGGQAVSSASITFQQYQSAVGKVINVLSDGRATIIVKVV
jgi:hypothetical protein